MKKSNFAIQYIRHSTDFVKSSLNIVRKTEKTGLLYFFVLFLVTLPYSLYYSQSFVYTIPKYSVDELEFLKVIHSLLSLSYHNLYSFSYGAVYWLISSFSAFPAWLLNSEQGMVVNNILRSLNVKRYIILILITFCFFSGVNIKSATQIHPETMYSFFICLSFYFLYEDSNNFEIYYYYSILAFALAFSVKTLAGLYGISYVIYHLYNSKKTSLRVVIKSFLCFAASFGVLNFSLLNFRTLRNYLANIQRMSSVVKHGWLGSAYGHNFSAFSINYINFYSFIILVLACLVLYFLCRKQENEQRVYFVIALYTITAYFIFCNFYASSAAHYGIALIFFLPFVIGYIIKNSSYNKQTKIVSYILFSAFFILNISTPKAALNLIMNPQGRERQRQKKIVLDKIKEFLKPIPQDSYRLVGVSHDLGVPFINGRKIPFSRLWVLSENALVNYDLIIFWKDDSYYKKLYKNKVDKFEETFYTYLKVKSGEVMHSQSIKYKFKNIFNDKYLEIYKKSIDSL